MWPPNDEANIKQLCFEKQVFQNTIVLFDETAELGYRVADRIQPRRGQVRAHTRFDWFCD